MTSVVQVQGIRVEASNDQHAEPIDLDRWATLLANGLDHEGVTGRAEANLVFVDDEAIARLKVDHLDGHGEPTDVLAFPIDDHDDTGPDHDDIPRMVGDIVICPGFARTNSSLDSLDDEVALLVVHGLLHLLGHDHAEPDEKARMQEREQALLDRFHR